MNRDIPKMTYSPLISDLKLLPSYGRSLFSFEQNSKLVTKFGQKQDTVKADNLRETFRNPDFKNHYCENYILGKQQVIGKQCLLLEKPISYA